MILGALITPAHAATEVQPGDNVSSHILTDSQYDLLLLGNAWWSTDVPINAARSGLTIDGQGYTVTMGTTAGANSGTNRIISSFTSGANVSLRNLVFTPKYAGSDNTALFTNNAIEIGAVTGVTLDLTGTTFTGFNQTTGHGGVLYVSSTSAVASIVSGTGVSDRLLFSNNRGSGDKGGAAGFEGGNVTFTGDVTFDSNWSGNYGGAFNTYESYGSALTFQGRTEFLNNRAVLFGGAIDIWGGSYQVTFNGETLFQGNRVYYLFERDTWENPYHEFNQIARGGALNMGYVASSGAAAIFNNAVSFLENFAVSTGQTDDNRHAIGGAVAVMGEGSILGNPTLRNNSIYFNSAAVFRGNYAYGLTGLGYGGAMYYHSPNNTLTFNSGTEFTDNYAKTLGGALYIRPSAAGQQSIINLNAVSDNILFRGNRQAAEFGAGGNYTPVLGTGTPNSIYVQGSARLNMFAEDGMLIEFYDPMATTAGSTVTVDKSGGGETILHGSGTPDPAYDWNIQATTSVRGGTFTLADGVGYGTKATDTVSVTNGTLRGNNSAELRANSVTIQNSGFLGANGGLFTVDATTITMQDGSGLSGTGTLAATSDLNTSGTITGAIADGDALNVTARLVGTGNLSKTGTGTLTLSAQNLYTGTTVVNAGILAAGIANAYAQSAAVTVALAATLDLNNYDQLANNLSGAGAITLGSGVLTANMTAGDNSFSGAITGTGRLIKSGGDTLTLSGNNGYSGGTDINAGKLTATTGQSVGTGTVNIASTGSFELAFAGDGSMGNQILGVDGLLRKTGPGVATLTNSGSSVGTVDVLAGGLSLQQNGVFTAGTYTTAGNAATTIGVDATLAVLGVFTQATGSTLNIAIGANNTPTITADSASIGGTLNVTGLTSPAIPAKASELDTNRYVIIKTENGITNDFDSVNLDLTNPRDYLVFDGRKSADGLTYSVGLGLAWLAGAQSGNGFFTLAANESFEVDVALADRTGVTFVSGWTGQDLTKAGAGTLVLSAVNTYTGVTNLTGGTLRTGIANAFAASTSVLVGAGATLDLGGYDQVAQNLAGAGTITLGSGTLTAQIDAAQTEFSGGISGAGGLAKTGAGRFLLSGTNTYSGGTSIQAGTLAATGGNAVGGGTVTIADPAATLELAFDSSSTLANQLAGTGSLLKTGAGVATLSATGSSVGAVRVAGGTLAFTQSGLFNAVSYTSDSGMTTSLGANARLGVTGAFSQAAGSFLNLDLAGGTGPYITANTASLSGTLTLQNFSATNPGLASTLASNLYTIVQVRTANGIGGDFTTLDFGGATAPADYLTLSGGKYDNNTAYRVGLGLTWFAGATLGNGLFTLPDAADLFNVDVVLSNQVASTTGWTGQDLTKAGAGTLILSAANTYTGVTNLTDGTLRTGIANAFAASTSVLVGAGATLDLGGYSQVAQNLAGAGAITLGSGTLTAQIDAAQTEFSGGISGAGGLAKTGTGRFLLSGTNTYSGGTSIQAGTLAATGGNAVGGGTVTIADPAATLELAFDSSSTLANQLAGTGSLVKTGAGVATLSATGSSVGAVRVAGGTLAFTQSGLFNAASYATDGGATTSLGANSRLNVAGAFSQAVNSTLSVALGTPNDPIITADNASLSGTLSVQGFTATNPGLASTLASNLYTIVQVRTANGISGDFTTLDFGGATAPADYLTLSGGKYDNNTAYRVGLGLTWFAGATLGNGLFTLPDAADLFNVDVVLSNQVASATGWTGQDLTKAGAGTLILSAVNTYTGSTTVTGGTLQTNSNNAFLNSSDVIINAGGVLNLNNTAQTANNLTGAGSIALGSSGTLTANVGTGDSSTFSGSVNGGGSVVKSGAGTQTLSGSSGYSGGTSIQAGTLIATNTGALGSGNIAVDTGAILNVALDAASSGSLGNTLSGGGTLSKSGAGDITLSVTGSSIGAVDVTQGALSLANQVAISTGQYTTRSGAETSLGADATLAVSGDFTQESGSTLSVAVGNTQPLITADRAFLAGSLDIAGFTVQNQAKASDLDGSRFTVIETQSGINGDFTSIDFGAATSPADYLVVDGRIDNSVRYTVGLGLKWYAGITESNGQFTLSNQNDAFEVDVALNNQTGPTGTGWDGASLTKAGTGTLTLSAANGYTGGTTVNGGTLVLAATDTIQNSGSVTVNQGGTVALQADQVLNNVGGAGNLNLGGSVLTANNNQATVFSGAISGTGSLTKTGSGDLTLSGTNTYSGGTTVSQDRLIATGGGSLGSGAVGVNTGGILELQFAGDASLGNSITGTGTLEKTGAGTATLSGTGFSMGAVAVQDGELALTGAGLANAGTWTTAGGAETSIGPATGLTVAGLFSQQAGSTLSVEIGDFDPIIRAAQASIRGALNIASFTAGNAMKASDLISTQFTIIQSDTAITGTFDAVNFGSSQSNADYLVVDGFFGAGNLTYNVGLGLTWYAGAAQGDGVFTLDQANEMFDVDVALDDRTGTTFTSGWDGTDLTKAGAGTLTLSAANGYTGGTTVNGGTLILAATDTIQNSGSVTVNQGGTVALQADQILNNVGGAGNLNLGGSVLTANNNQVTEFSGVISGTGSLTKTGSGDLTLSGTNTYSGGTTVSQDRLIATGGGSLGSGAVGVNTGGILELQFAGDASLNNSITGTGTLEKTGAGTATLSGTGFSMGAVAVQDGELALTGAGLANAGTWTTAGGAETFVGPETGLTVAGLFSQQAGSTLSVEIGDFDPIIRAAQASIGGVLNIASFTAGNAMKASDLMSTDFTIIQSDTAISGTFDSVNFGSTGSGADYLVVDGFFGAGNLTYNVGLGLTWYADAAKGDGVFTLDQANEMFDVDVALNDRTGTTFTSGWDGTDLTKNGAGTLILSAANGYSGETTVNGGSLVLKADDALGATRLLDIKDAATVRVDGTDQSAGKLVTEDGATLNLDGGSLTITDTQRAGGDADGGTIAGGTLIGTGALDIMGSNVQVQGANTGYSGDVDLGGGSVLTLQNAAGAGLGGSVTLNAANDRLVLDGTAAGGAAQTLQKDLIGSGEVETVNGADIALGGDNSAFGGLFDVTSGSTLRASNPGNLGTAAVDLAGTLVVDAGSRWVLENTVTGAGEMVKQGTANLIVYDSLAGHTGTTSVRQGTLIVGDATTTGALGSSQVNVAPGAILSGTGTISGNTVNQGGIYALNSLSGYQGVSPTNLTVGNLDNQGVINLAGSVVGNTLTVRGDLVSNGGSLVINTVLGDDNSPTDRLILDGGRASGSTSVVVRNVGGPGLATNVGILVVEAINGATTANDAFVLSPASPGFRSDTRTVAAGAYDYSLVRGGNGGFGENWYLSSLFKQEDGGGARPEAGAYLANQEIAETMFMHRMVDRLTGYQTLTDPISGKKLLGAAWARMDGYTTRSRANKETLKTRTNAVVFHTGLDIINMNSLNYGNLRAGAMFGTGHAHSNSEQSRGGGKARSDTDGYAAGLYATWFQNEERRDGFYADSWVQHAWFDHSIDGDGLPGESYSSRMWSASLEGGYSFTLHKSAGSSWSFDPSAQLVYSRHHGTDHTEEGGTRVRQDHKENLTLRAGGRLHGRKEFEDAPTIEPYIEAYWWHNDKRAGITMDADPVRSDKPRDFVEVRAGIGTVLTDNLSLTLGATAQVGEKSYRQYGGQLGLRLEW